MIIKYLSNSIIKGGQAPVFDNPASFGLAYEDVTFKASDGVPLSGWLIQGGSDKVIIQSHFGVQASRSGYTPEGKGLPKMWPENIAFLRQAKYLVEAGYSVLMYDFRNHGNSGTGSCPWVTWGPEEHKDILAAVDFISNHPTYKQSQIGLFSICMGAAASTYAYGQENGLAQYSNIKAMVAVQPLLYPDFVRALGLPNFLAKRVTKLNNERTGIDLVSTSFMPSVKQISVPTLLIQNSNDEYLHRAAIDEFYNNLVVEKELLWLDLNKERAAAYDWLGENPDKILSWFSKYMT